MTTLAQESAHKATVNAAEAARQTAQAAAKAAYNNTPAAWEGLAMSSRSTKASLRFCFAAGLWLAGIASAFAQQLPFTLPANPISSIARAPTLSTHLLRDPQVSRYIEVRSFYHLRFQSRRITRA